MSHTLHLLLVPDCGHDDGRLGRRPAEQPSSELGRLRGQAAAAGRRVGRERDRGRGRGPRLDGHLLEAVVVLKDRGL